MPSLSNVIRNGIASLSSAAGATDVHLTIRVSTTGQQGRWPALPVGLAMDVDAAPNPVSRAVVGVASGQPTLTAAYATYSVRITAPLGNAYTSGTQVVFVPLLLPIDDLDDITLRKGQTANINLFRHFLYSGGDQSDIVWSISPANSNQPVGYLSRSGTSVTIHASGAGRVQMVIGASAGGSTLRHTAFLTVTDANRAPVVSHNPPGITLKVSGNGAAIHPAAFFTDADGDTLTITAVASGVGVVLQDDGGGVWSVQPLSVAGTAQVVWTADDGHGGVVSATQVFTLGPNRAPIVVHRIVPQAMLVSSNLAIPLGAVFSDPDNDALNYFAFSNDDDVASVDAGANQAAVLSAAWFVGSGGIASGATSVSLDATPVGFGGSVAFLIGAYLALGGQRAKITAATLVGSRLRLSDRQRVSTLTLTLDTGGYPLNVAAFTQMYLRGSRVALSGASIPLTAKATPSSTSITAIASDGTDEVSDIFTLIVHRAPIWQNIPDQSVVAGSAVVIDLARYAIEPDGDRLTFSVTSVEPGVVASVRRDNLYIHGIRPSTDAQDVVVRATDVHGAFAEQTISVRISGDLFPGARAPLISRFRVHQLIDRRADVVFYEALFDGQLYPMRGIVPADTEISFEEVLEDEFLALSANQLSISDWALDQLPIEVRAELTTDALYERGSETAGQFIVRDLRFRPAGKTEWKDSERTLMHIFTLSVPIAPFVPIPALNAAALQVRDLWPLRLDFTPFRNESVSIVLPHGGLSDFINGDATDPNDFTSPYLPTDHWGYQLLNTTDVFVPPLGLSSGRGTIRDPYSTAPSDTRLAGYTGPQPFTGLSLDGRTLSFTHNNIVSFLYMRVSNATHNVYQDQRSVIRSFN